MSARDTLNAIYLDWFNNYCSIDTFAEHNGLTQAQAIDLINLARNVHYSKHPDA